VSSMHGERGLAGERRDHHRGLTALAGKMLRTAKPAKTDGLEPSTVVSLPSPAKQRMSITSSEQLKEKAGDKYNVKEK
jgi:hypothetical protein